MPIIKSAIKRMKQNRTRHARNQHYSSHMKSMIKLMMEYIQKGDLENAKKILPKVVSAIDTASKKNLIHNHNAAHKKSKLEKALTAAVKNPVKPVKEEKAEAKTEEKAEKVEKKKKAPAKKKDDK